LHGNEAGSVDKAHNLPGGRLVGPDPNRLSKAKQLMDQPAYSMDQTRREAVLAAFVQRCTDSNWNLLAAHIRMNHVHLVVEADVPPEKIMNDLKSYASRCLNKLGLDEPTRKRWARHGSTRWLWNQQSVTAAIRYVVEGQGDPMAVYEG
jgi:REP element-mobilizing transposase RayT